MYVLIDTSTHVVKITIVNKDGRYNYEWAAGRDMARGLLGFLERTLAEYTSSMQQVAGWGVFAGPGSFTGLRIGITTVNTLGYFLKTPIVGAVGEDWQNQALARLKAGETDEIILPEYGRAARITQPRK